MRLVFITIIFSFLYQAKCLNTKLNTIKKNLFKEKLSNCKVKLDDGSIIDLSELNNPSNPMYFQKINIFSLVKSLSSGRLWMIQVQVIFTTTHVIQSIVN